MMEPRQVSFSIKKEPTFSDSNNKIITLDNLPDDVHPKKLFTRLLLKHVNAIIEKSKSKNKSQKMEEKQAQEICEAVFKRLHSSDQQIELVKAQTLASWLEQFTIISYHKINREKLIANILDEYKQTLTQKYEGHIFPCDTYIFVARQYVKLFEKSNSENKPLIIARLRSIYIAQAVELYAAANKIEVKVQRLRVEMDNEYKDTVFNKPVKTFKKLLKEHAYLYLTAEEETELLKKFSDVNKTLNTEEIAILTKFAENDNADAQGILGYCYYEGIRGFSKDYKQAFFWLSKAAKLKQPVAQFLLGRYYMEGLAEKKNITKAMTWYQNAAEQAVFWLEKAANQGEKDSQFALAICYKNGDGVPQDHKKAAMWLQKAAENDLAEAQYVLATWYEAGFGVSKDIETAITWFKKSAINGNEKAKEYLREIAALIEKIEKTESDDLKKSVQFAKDSPVLSKQHMSSHQQRYEESKEEEKIWNPGL